MLNFRHKIKGGKAWISPFLFYILTQQSQPIYKKLISTHLNNWTVLEYHQFLPLLYPTPPLLENAFVPYLYLPFSVSLACFSTFSGLVVCISPFVFYMYRYLYIVFSCVTSRELSHLSALCRVAMFTRLDWLSGITWDGLTRMQLVCAFPLPLQ